MRKRENQLQIYSSIQKQRKNNNNVYMMKITPENLTNEEKKVT